MPTNVALILIDDRPGPSNGGSIRLRFLQSGVREEVRGPTVSRPARECVY